MATATVLMTAEELEHLPNKDKLHELVRGELRTMPAAGFEHGLIGINLASPLAAYVRAHALGYVVLAETGFLLSRDPDTVRAPDIGFVTRERIEKLGVTKKYWPGAPDLAVEIVSPNDTVNELDEKVQDWLAAGTRLVWVVNPRRRTVTVHALGAKPVILTDTDVLDGGDVVPGFRIAVAEPFPPPI
jgi:Uma2 family endonuclease